ncbi:MAG: HEAT repeat domain-containing protein [Bryobacteraceae bacterium]
MQGPDEVSVSALIRQSLDSAFEGEDAVGDPRSFAAWEAIATLARRADEQVIKAAATLLGSDDAWHRARGANILGLFPTASWADARFTLLSDALRSEADERAIPSLIHSIGHLHNPRILPRFLELGQHPNREVRLAVAMSIMADWGHQAVAALIGLCADEWGGVRDWATFKFRTSDVDSPEIRQCIRSRLQDPEPAVRAEAICALARRRDLTCLEQLLDDLGRLDDLDDESCHLEAACHLLGCGLDDERSTDELRADLMRMYRKAKTRE